MHGQVGHRHQTALHVAVGAGVVVSVILLLKWGADPDIKDTRGKTLLESAQKGSNCRINALLDLILESEAEESGQAQGAVGTELRPTETAEEVYIEQEATEWKEPYISHESLST